MGNDFCYNTDKFYIKISYFLGLCIDYCPYLYYSPVYETTLDTKFYKYMDFINRFKCVKCPEMLITNEEITNCYDASKQDYV